MPAIARFAAKTEEQCNYAAVMSSTEIAFVGSYEKVTSVQPAATPILNHQGSTV